MSFSPISCYASDAELMSLADEIGFSYTQMRYARVCYLYHVVGERRSKISEITGYAVSTLSSLRNKVLYLLDSAKSFFYTLVPDLHDSCANVVIESKEDCSVYEPGKQLTYLFKFYDVDGNLLFSKIGTTTRGCVKRIKEEIRYYKKSFPQLAKAEICKIIDCGNVPAEGFESYLRAVFIKRYSGTWKKNDRFFGVDISIEDFVNVCNIFVNF